MKWIDVNGYEGIYQVNRKGEIKSLERLVKNGRNSYMLRKERILKHGLTGGAHAHDRYQAYNLTDSLGVHKMVYRHVLMATYFIPNPNNLNQVNHKNGKKRDNRIANLEWSTGSSNIQHAVKKN